MYVSIVNFIIEICRIEYLPLLDFFYLNKGWDEHTKHTHNVWQLTQVVVWQEGREKKSTMIPLKYVVSLKWLSLHKQTNINCGSNSMMNHFTDQKATESWPTKTTCREKIQVPLLQIITRQELLWQLSYIGISNSKFKTVG